MVELSTNDAEGAVKTWRYLRLSMIAMVLGLAVAVLYERAHRACFQDSISAYYYTPARGFFVGALVSIGVCLVALKGRTDVEDVMLNLAGAFAPVVAFVPTPYGTRPCAATDDAGRDANVANNVTALLVVALVALVVVACLVWLAGPAERTRPSMVGWFVAAALWVAAWAAFVGAREVFLGWAHYTAAILMFGLIFAVVVVTSRRRGDAPWRNRYAIVAWAMGASVLAALIAGFVLHWQYTTIAVEVAMIAEFAWFWIVQTHERWDEGLA